MSNPLSTALFYFRLMSTPPIKRKNTTNVFKKGSGRAHHLFSLKVFNLNTQREASSRTSSRLSPSLPSPSQFSIHIITFVPLFSLLCFRPLFLDLLYFFFLLSLADSPYKFPLTIYYSSLSYLPLLPSIKNMK